MKRILAVFGPVPSGGNPALPGIVLFAIGLLGLLSLPAQLAKMKSGEGLWYKVAFLVAVDLAFVLGGLVMFAKRP
jgi:hypothetical protein